MQVQAKTTIEFNAAQVQEMIADYVRKSFPHCRDVKSPDIKFTVNAGYSDQREYAAPSLVNAKVEILVKSIDPTQTFTR